MTWEKVKLGELCTVTSSKRFHLSERSKSGVPFYCSKEIIQKINHEEILECDYIEEKFYESIAERFGVPQADDLLVTTRGTIGIPYVYKADDKFYFADGNLTWIKDFKSSLYSKWLYYWFLSHEGKKKIDAIAKGTAQKAVPIAGIKQLELQLPPVSIQKKVASILSAYDDLIENNKKQIKLLEEAAQRLYKEWFVDLRFPGHENVPVVDGVPEGWSVERLDTIIQFHDNKRKPLSSKQRASFAGEYRYYGAAGILDYVKTYIYDGTYLLMGEDGSVITANDTPVLQYVTGKFWVNNHAHVLTGKDYFSTEFIYMMLSQMSVSDVVTGVAQPKISQARLSAKTALLPSQHLVVAYQKIAKPIFDKILGIEKKITLLSQARNFLLPKLRSGEIEV